MATYHYTGEACRLLCQVVRYDPKDFSNRRVVGYLRGGTYEYEWNLDGRRRVLYRLPEVVEGIRDGRWIFLCEGEKDADNMSAEGFVATTACGGTSIKNYAKLHGDQLRGAYVCILPDNDPAGRKRAVQIARQLHGIAKGITIVHLFSDSGDNKEDVSDFIDNMHRASETVLNEMLHIMNKINWYFPLPGPVFEKPRRFFSGLNLDMVFEAQRLRAHLLPIEQIAVVVRGKTRCPLPSHIDEHPSCSVKENLWYCHVCDEGGDTILFKRNRDSESFHRAVKELCGGG